jgi:hypothetical protein
VLVLSNNLSVNVFSLSFQHQADGALTNSFLQTCAASEHKHRKILPLMGARGK